MMQKRKSYTFEFKIKGVVGGVCILHYNSITVRVRTLPKEQHKSYTYELKIQGARGECAHAHKHRRVHCCYGYLTLTLDFKRATNILWVGNVHLNEALK